MLRSRKKANPVGQRPESRRPGWLLLRRPKSPLISRKRETGIIENGRRIEEKRWSFIKEDIGRIEFLVNEGKD